MADYPDLPIRNTSTVSVNDGVKLSRADNGALRGVRSWTENKATLVLKHVLDADQRAVLDTFYAENATAEVTHDSPLASGAFVFAGPPQYTLLSTTHTEATVKLEAV